MLTRGGVLLCCHGGMGIPFGGRCRRHGYGLCCNYALCIPVTRVMIDCGKCTESWALYIYICGALRVAGHMNNERCNKSFLQRLHDSRPTYPKMRATGACTVLLAAIIAGHAQNFSETAFSEELREAFDESNRNLADYLSFEWEGYDGWYNNPAHPDWGGAGTTFALAAV